MTLAETDFDALYRKHASGAFTRARRLLGNDADAHEVVHDLFVSLLESPQQFEGRSGLTTFMYKAVTHACLNRIRNQRTRRRLLQLRQLELRDQPESVHSEISATLLSELKRMPENLATIAVYYYIDGLTHDEIALIMACSPRQIGKLLSQITEDRPRKPCA